MGRVDPRCPTQVVGDGARLRQALVDLLSSAVRFTPSGPELRATAFDPFGRGDTPTGPLDGAAGAGLTASQRLVEAMGGVLEVKRVPGMGSTTAFTVTVPRGPRQEPIAAELIERPGHPSSVLLVTDQLTTRNVLRQQLEAWGMGVTEAASDLEAAIMILETAGSFDVALVDREMPGLNGRELSDALHAHASTRSLPIILLTSLDDATGVEQAGFAGVLRKPVRTIRLKEALAEALPG